jgi:hypothetical protein
MNKFLLALSWLFAPAAFAQSPLYSVQMQLYQDTSFSPPTGEESANCNGAAQGVLNRNKVNEALKQAGSSLTDSVITVNGNDNIVEFRQAIGSQPETYLETCTATITSNDQSVDFVTNTQEFDHNSSFDACQNAYVAAQLNPATISSVKTFGTRGIFLNYCLVTTVSLSINAHDL